ncbi:hypothetical protein OIU84_021165 [Salix udensis]|uniref:ARM repeat superfamily protein n=1 Tax=Salix udensis TaxID=889485 RepID=A0AAD6KU23_9ROSI|nr:hypothetical protein OIU84_021165 [Salix udensis]
MVLEAIRDLHDICKKKQYNKIQIHNAGILPLLFKLLKDKDRDIRYAALELLRELAKDDDDSKIMISEVVDMSAVIKMMSSGHQPIRHAALLLLLELSRSEILQEKIGSVPGGILVLIRIKYNQSDDAFSSEKADEILKNLESSPENIKKMAENGLFEPLLKHLTEGSEEMQTEMAEYLGEIALGHDSETYVAERASPPLIKMVLSGNPLTRTAAFKALAKIASFHPNATILAKSGIVQRMVEEMFARRIHGEPINSKTEAAAILANIFEAGLDLENLQVNSHGHILASDYVLYSIIEMIKHSTPDELNINLIRILLCLAKSPKSMSTIVSMVKESEASYILVELLNNPHEELGIAATKLLIGLIPYMGHTIVERLCKTAGQPENLILVINETTRITHRQAVSSTFLAKLPHQSLTLNLALLGKNTVPTVLQQINQIQGTGIRTSRGACSSQNTFCLVDAKAVERLLACLGHENFEVVEAALSAVCTLLDDKVDVEKSVGMLCEVNAIQHVLNADRLLPATLVNAFHHGDTDTRQMAEKILRHLNKIPNSPTSHTSHCTM